MTAMTAAKVRNRKTSDDPLVMLTAYDYPTARIVDQAGVDMILVGDTAGMVVHGFPDTTQMTVEVMATHVAAVARAEPQALIIGDMPWLSYHGSPEATVENAARLIRSGAGAVKLEGGHRRTGAIRALIDAEIPVMGHLGMTPQSIKMLGSMRRVAAKNTNAARELLDDALLLSEVGCFALVLEAIPAEVAKLVTERVAIPTIGIGAGPHCNGQVLVVHDVLGLDDRMAPKFLRRYANLKSDAVNAVNEFVEDVRNRRYPSKAEAYTLPDDIKDAIASMDP